MKIKLTKKREVFDYCVPYIIAEIGSNHNGDMRLAKKLISSARKAGADCVKFQSWSKESIFSKKVYKKNFFLSDDYRRRKDFTLEQIVEKYSISEGHLKSMKEFSEKKGIDCISTPFSKNEVDFLVEILNVEFIKIASMDLNNYPFLRYVALKKLPVVLSTGLSSLSEIDRAVRTIESAGNRRIILLHCVAKYPPDDSEVNLNRIATLRNIYPYPVGFSDHSTGSSVPLAAAALGACIIEKHFTLDKNMPGWDHKVSADFDELNTIVSGTKRIQKALGSTRISVIEDKARLTAFRRSIVAKRKINKGEKFTEDMLDFKRPADGLAPEFFDTILGKVAKRDIGYDDQLKAGDF